MSKSKNCQKYVNNFFFFFFNAWVHSRQCYCADISFQSYTACIIQDMHMVYLSHTSTIQIIFPVTPILVCSSYHLYGGATFFTEEVVAFIIHVNDRKQPWRTTHVNKVNLHVSG